MAQVLPLNPPGPPCPHRSLIPNSYRTLSVPRQVAVAGLNPPEPEYLLVLNDALCLDCGNVVRLKLK
jgi:hypothetical protein